MLWDKNSQKLRWRMTVQSVLSVVAGSKENSFLLDDVEACTEHEMVWDKPSMENGREKEFGALGPDATRVLTNPLERGHES